MKLKNQKLAALILALAMVFALASGCGSNAAPAETPAPAESAAPAESEPAASEEPAVPETRTVVDMDGNEVTVPYEITDCFNAYPVSNGIMALLGVEDTQSYYLPRVSSPNWAWLRVFNSLINEKPQIGEDASVSAEELLTIAPQVVILSNAETAQGTLPWDTYGPEQAMAVLRDGKDPLSRSLRGHRPQGRDDRFLQDLLRL